MFSSSSCSGTGVCEHARAHTHTRPYSTLTNTHKRASQNRAGKAEEMGSEGNIAKPDAPRSVPDTMVEGETRPLTIVL